MKQMTKHTGSSYEGIASRYAEAVDSKPWNAYYERPAVTSLLPPLQNLKVLDVGCGSGWYAEYLLSRGATVTAFDVNADFVSLTQSRVGDRAQVLQADLAEPLDFRRVHSDVMVETAAHHLDRDAVQRLLQGLSYIVTQVNEHGIE